MLNKKLEQIEKKIDVVGDAFKAKRALKAVTSKKDKLSEYEYTMLLANDEGVRKATQIITEGILNPTPLTSLKTERTNRYLDVGLGISTFVDEMRKFDPKITESAALIETKAMHLDLGLSKDVSPHMRKQLLSMAGLDTEDIEKFVTYEDYYEYEARSVATFREYHMERLGFQNEDDMSEEEKEMLESLVADSVAVGIGEMSQQVEVMNDLELYGNPRRYEELFGIDSKTMHETFGDGKHEIPEHMYPEYTNGYTMSEHDPMYEAMREYQELMHGSTDMNQETLLELARQRDQMKNVNLSVDDLDGLEAPEEKEVPVISDEELASLGLVEPEYQQ